MGKKTMRNPMNFSGSIKKIKLCRACMEKTGILSEEISSGKKWRPLGSVLSITRKKWRIASTN